MATAPTVTDPQQGPPDTPGGPTAVSPDQQQANPLQTEMSDITRRLILLAQQNPPIAPFLAPCIKIMTALLRKILMTPQQSTPQQGPQQM
jgi:hypothetical protein